MSDSSYILRHRTLVAEEAAAGMPEWLRKRLAKARAEFAAAGGCPGCKSLILGVHEGGCPTSAKHPYD